MVADAPASCGRRPAVDREPFPESPMATPDPSPQAPQPLPSEANGAWDVEASFRALVQHAADVFAILAADGAIRYESSAVTRVLGYTPAALVGTDAFALIHPADVAAVRTRFQQALDQPGVELVAEFRHRHQDGSWRWLEATAINLLADPHVAGVVVTYRDVTERKRAEDRRSQAAALLREVGS